MVPTSGTARILFARSGNRCAFPECFAPLVEDNDIITGEICHIRARNPGGPRYDERQTEEERNSSENLLLLCSRHHKIIDSDVSAYSVELLEAIKKERESRGDVAVTPEIARRADLLLQDFVVHVQGDFVVSEIHAQTVTFQSKTKWAKPKTFPPADAVGGSSAHRAYLKYLIDRYNEFARSQRGREFSHAVVYRSINRQFKTDWEWIPLARFVEVVSFVQAKIDSTIIGRQRKSQRKASYEDFHSYVCNHRGGAVP